MTATMTARIDERLERPEFITECRKRSWKCLSQERFPSLLSIDPPVRSSLPARIGVPFASPEAVLNLSHGSNVENTFEVITLSPRRLVMRRYGHCPALPRAALGWALGSGYPGWRWNAG